MPQTSDLMGLGMAAALAETLGNTPLALTGAGTNQATAAAIQSKLTILTSATGATGCVFASGAYLGGPHWVTVTTGSTVTGVVYCPVSGTMNGAANGSLSVAAGKTAVFISTAQSAWVSILTA